MSLLAQNTQLNNTLNTVNEASGQQIEIVDTLSVVVDVLINICISFGLIFAFYLLGHYISSRIIRALRLTQGETLYPDMVIFINRFAVLGCVFVGVAIAIQFVFKLDFVQVIGFFGLGISFAFKDLLSNLIAGAVIILQNRFRIGDFIQIGSGPTALKGKIMEIQGRIMVLKAIDGSEIIIPNADFLVKPVMSFTAHKRRMVDFNIGISFDSDIEKAQSIAIENMLKNPFVLQKPKPRVLVKNIAENAVTLSIRFWIDPQDKTQSWVVTKSEIIASIKKAFDENSIHIPFPIRVIKQQS